MNEFVSGLSIGSVGVAIIALIDIYKLEKENKELNRKLKVKSWLEERRERE